MSDLQLQQYLFDVQGYLVVENVLSPEEVAALNQCVDEQQLPTPGKVQRFGSAPGGPGFFAVGKTFLQFTRPSRDYADTSIPLGRLLSARSNLRDVYAGRDAARTAARRLWCDLSNSKSKARRILLLPR